MTTCASPPDLWFPVDPDPAASVRLYSFPHAGAGVHVYQSWRSLLPERVACVPVRLPGRETRLGEPPLTQLEPLVELLADALARVLEPPYALYGHSMGAIVAFELARSLRRLGVEPPLGLIVSGRPAPDVVPPRPGMHTLPDDELTSQLRSLGGLPDAVASSHDLLAFFLPLLRADLAVNEAYEHRVEAPLARPITALGGAADPRVSLEEVAAWRLHTAAAFRFEVMPGGHFFPFEAAGRVLPLVVRQLDEWSSNED